MRWPYITNVFTNVFIRVYSDPTDPCKRVCVCVHLCVCVHVWCADSDITYVHMKRSKRHHKYTFMHGDLRAHMQIYIYTCRNVHTCICLSTQHKHAHQTCLRFCFYLCDTQSGILYKVNVCMNVPAREALHGWWRKACKSSSRVHDAPTNIDAMYDPYLLLRRLSCFLGSPLYHMST